MSTPSVRSELAVAAFNEGFVAHTCGAHYSECPHERGSELRRAWGRGWEAAADLRIRELEEQIDDLKGRIDAARRCC